MSASNPTKANGFLDLIAITLSGLCVIHCLALPALIVALPALGIFTDEHWVHQLLISMAAPISLWAVGRSGLWRRPGIGIPMIAGLSMLGVAAFYPPFEMYETVLSVSGALLLAFAHFRNARLAHRRRHDGVAVKH